MFSWFLEQVHAIAESTKGDMNDEDRFVNATTALRVRHVTGLRWRATSDAVRTWKFFFFMWHGDDSQNKYVVQNRGTMCSFGFVQGVLDVFYCRYSR